MHTASQALAIERQASAQPSLAERVSRPKTRAILGLMRLNFLRIPLIADTHSQLIADSVPGDRASRQGRGDAIAGACPRSTAANWPIVSGPLIPRRSTRGSSDSCAKVNWKTAMGQFAVLYADRLTRPTAA